MTNTETGATVPEGTAPIIPSRPQGVCLIEIWITADKRAPSHFWREMQADGVFSHWRFMEPSFAKKALRAAQFTLDKDRHAVQYAARRVDVRSLTMHDYNRVKVLREAFRSCPDPVLLCKSCQGSKVIQATRRTSATEVQRFDTQCPECRPIATAAEVAATGDAAVIAEHEKQLAAVGTWRIVEEVPGVPPSERYYVTGPNHPPKNFGSLADAREYLRLALVPDECVKFEPFTL